MMLQQCLYRYYCKDVPNLGRRTPGSQPPGVPPPTSPRQPTTVGRRGLGTHVQPDGERKMAQNAPKIPSQNHLNLSRKCCEEPQLSRRTPGRRCGAQERQPLPNSFLHCLDNPRQLSLQTMGAPTTIPELRCGTSTV